MPSTTEERRRGLESEIEEYASSHFRGQEAYEFNIKVQKIDLPRGVHRLFDQDVIDTTVGSIFGQTLKAFAEDLKQRFPWIHDWYQEGRSGGWLVLEPDYGLLDKEAGIQSLRNRLKDLHTIDKMVKKGVRDLIHLVESRDFWELKKQDWSPRDE